MPNDCLSLDRKDESVNVATERECVIPAQPSISIAAADGGNIIDVQPTGDMSELLDALDGLIDVPIVGGSDGHLNKEISKLFPDSISVAASSNQTCHVDNNSLGCHENSKLTQPTKDVNKTTSNSIAATNGGNIIDVHPTVDMSELLDALDGLVDVPPSHQSCHSDVDTPACSAKVDEITAKVCTSETGKVEGMCTSLLSALNRQKSETGSDPWNPSSDLNEIKSCEEYDSLGLSEILDKFDDFICEAAGSSSSQQVARDEPIKESSLTTMCRSLMKDLKVHKERTGTDPWSGPTSPNNNQTSVNNNKVTVIDVMPSDDMTKLLDAFDIISEDPQEGENFSKQSDKSTSEVESSLTTMCRSLMKDLKVHKEMTGTDPWSEPTSPNNGSNPVNEVIDTSQYSSQSKLVTQHIDCDESLESLVKNISRDIQNNGVPSELFQKVM